MADRYPKSREELQLENAVLVEQIAALEKRARGLEALVAAKEQEVQALRRRRPPHKMDPEAPDKFRRPAFGRR